MLQEINHLQIFGDPVLSMAANKTPNAHKKDSLEELERRFPTHLKKIPSELDKMTKLIEKTTNGNQI